MVLQPYKYDIESHTFKEWLELLRAAVNDANFDSVVAVREASDLAGDLSSTILYYIDGAVDMGTQSITVPEGGLHLASFGLSISMLFSTEDNYTMFISPATYSGDLRIDGVDLKTSGTNSQVYDLDNDGNGNTCELINGNYDTCTALGTVANYRQGFWSNVAFLNTVDGITLDGVMAGGFTAVDSLVIPTGTFTGTLFKAGASLQINGSFRSNMNVLGVASGGKFTDISPDEITEDAAFFMNGVRGDPDLDLFPNMPNTSIKALFTDCVGISNTRPGIEILIDGAAVNDVITQNEYIQLQAEASPQKETWFSQYGGTSEELAVIYDSEQTLDVNIHLNMAFSASGIVEVGLRLRQWVDADSQYVDIGPVNIGTTNQGPAGDRAEGVDLATTATLNKNDRIEVWGANLTNTTDITTEDHGNLLIQAQ